MDAMLRQMMRGEGGGGGGGEAEEAPMDTAETVQISSLALLKMLKHGRAGVPMEVMGIMLGEFVDDYTVRVLDCFAMPQAASGVSVEAVDPEYQAAMLEMLKQTGRGEFAVGWYHSHPGFGCWLSGTDVNTAASFEKLNARSVSVVIDPIQSVKGKVVIDAFRCTSQRAAMTGAEPRQTTAVVGQLNKPTVQARMHGLGRYYYSIPIAYRKNELETKMLQNLHLAKWTKGLALRPFSEAAAGDAAAMADTERHAALYATRVAEEQGKKAEEARLAAVGKVDPKKRLEAGVAAVMSGNISQCLGAMLDTVALA
jgi:26S proteasome regulatory subunit N11